VRNRRQWDCSRVLWYKAGGSHTGNAAEYAVKVAARIDWGWSNVRRTAATTSAFHVAVQAACHIQQHDNMTASEMWGQSQIKTKNGLCSMP